MLNSRSNAPHAPCHNVVRSVPDLAACCCVRHTICATLGSRPPPPWAAVSVPKSGRRDGRDVCGPSLWTAGRCCCSCQKLAGRLGYTVNAYEGQRDRKPVRNRHMPHVLPEGWGHARAGSRVPFVRTACQECSRRLGKGVWRCEGCHESGLCWDHAIASPASLRVIGWMWRLRGAFVLVLNE